MTDVLDRARADLAAGRAWKARDRLTGALRDRQDEALLELLARVHLYMGELPSAGCLFFALGADDDDARAAIAAWRERFSSDEARWYSLPGPVRRSSRARQLVELERASRRERSERWARQRATLPRSERLADVACGTIALAVLALLIALVAIGGFTVASWLHG